MSYYIYIHISYNPILRIVVKFMTMSSNKYFLSEVTQNLGSSLKLASPGSSGDVY